MSISTWPPTDELHPTALRSLRVRLKREPLGVRISSVFDL